MNQYSQRSFQEFPESVLTAAEMQVIPADWTEPVSLLHQQVPYAQKDGRTLHLQIIEPRQQEGENVRFPLVVYVQGSAWMEQNVGYEIPQLSAFSRRGFVVAVVEYRPSSIALFPAQIKDTKTAIRFLTAHAEDYHIDTSKITLWGDSSGGHTAVLTALTMDDGTMDDEWAGEESKISLQALVDFYGPSDISRMSEEPSIMDHDAPDSPEGLLIGGCSVATAPEQVYPTVAMNHITDEKDLPPFLIVHGSKDRTVPFGQSVFLYDCLKEHGKQVDFYQLKGADHGGAPFWTVQLMDLVETFIRRSF